MASLYEDKEHAKLYAKYRPSYPDSIYESIINYCKAGDRDFSFDLAVDVACGSGQGTLPLCKYFTSVVGVDISEEQISSVPPIAESYRNVTFRVGRGEDLSFLPNNSVDLLTVATAMHRLPIDLFYAEVNRVLKPNGVFAAYGYTITVLSLPEAETWNAEFNHELLADYWDSRTVHRIPQTSPFPNSERRVGDAVSFQHTTTVDDYIGYLSTYSAWRAYLTKNTNSDALLNLRSRFCDESITPYPCGDQSQCHILMMYPKQARRIASSAYPDQTAPSGAGWSGSTLIAHTLLSEYLGLLDVYRRVTQQHNPLITVTWPAFMLLARKSSES